MKAQVVINQAGVKTLLMRLFISFILLSVSNISYCLEELKETDLEEVSIKNISKIIEPGNDGKKYSGKISFCTDRQGNISDIKLKQPSGNEELDKAFIAAVIKTKKIHVPEDHCSVKTIDCCNMTIFYDESDIPE